LKSQGLRCFFLFFIFRLVVLIFYIALFVYIIFRIDVLILYISVFFS